MEEKNNKGFNRQAVSLLVCFIAAFCLWIYVSYVENPDMTRWIKDIPVTVSGEAKLNEKGLAVKGLSSAEIDVKVRAKRSVFKDLSAETIAAVADVSTLSQTGENTLTVSVAFPGSSSGVTIADRSKMDIRVNVEEFVTRTVSIEPVISKNPANGYYVKSVKLPEGDMLLSVSGCSSNVEKVHHISTNDVDLSTTVDNVVLPLIFTAVDADSKLVDDVTLSLSSASVTFEIYKEAAIPLSVNVTADDPDITYEMNPTAVYVTGPAAVVDKLEPIVVTNINEYSYKDGSTLSASIPVPASVTLRERESTEVNIKFTEISN